MPQHTQRSGIQSAESSLIDDLVTANRILSSEGVLDGFGHVSARHGGVQEHFLLSRSLAPAFVTKEDILCFDLNGDALDGAGQPLYLERFIHSEIYSCHAHVNAIVHSHSPAVIPFCSAKVTLRPLYHMSSFLGSGAPVFEIRDVGGLQTDMLIRTQKLGAALAAKLGGSSVILMRGHGNVVVGKSLQQAVFRAIYTEINARLQIQALGLGGGEVTYLNEFEAAAADAVNTAALSRSWELWRTRALRLGNDPLPNRTERVGR